MDETSETPNETQNEIPNEEQEKKIEQSDQPNENNQEEIEIEFMVETKENILQSVNKKIKFNENQNIEQIIDRVAKEFDIQNEIVNLSWNGQVLRKETTIKELIEIQNTKNLKLNINFDFLQQVTPQIKPKRLDEKIEVEIYYGEGQMKKVVVEVVPCQTKKPFLGGYRHKITQLEYHHAFTQTDRIKKEGLLKGPQKFTRETQTKKWKTRSQQTCREQGTQMEKPGLYIDTKNDKIIIPSGRYFSSEDLEKLRLEKVIFIQAFVRGWFARKKAKQYRREKQEQEEARKREEELNRQKEENRKRQEMQRRMHPRKPKDFNTLYSELELWREEEIKKVKNNAVDEHEKRLGLLEVLRKETKLLQTLDRLKITANLENRQEAIHKKLEMMAKPKPLKNWDGKYTYIETPLTIRARELMELYHGLNTSMLSIDERLDVLLHVKWTVKEFDCPLTRDIVELIDKEADLLNRGRKDSSLEGLRRRLSNLFLRFIETPEFNPEALRIQRVPLEYAIRPDVQLFTKPE